MKNIKNFRSFELFEAASFFKPLIKVNLADPTPAQEKKLETFSDQKKIDFDKFLNDGARMEVVIDAPGLKAGDLYDGMRSWLFKYYEDPKKSEGRWDKSISKGVIRGIFNIENILLGGRCEVSYSLDFLFKDDKFKVIYSNLENQYYYQGKIVPDNGKNLTGKLSDPSKIEVVKKYLQKNPNPQEEEPSSSSTLVLPAMDSPFSSGESSGGGGIRKPYFRLYDSAYNNGTAIFLSIQEYTSQMKPGSLGSEFDF
jgi:hypothetical protein